MAAGVFDLKEMQTILDGVSIEGFGDGDAMSLSYREDAVTMMVGADGRTYFAVSNDESATCELNIQWGSPASVAIREVLSGKKPVGFFMRDPSTGTEWSTDSAMVGKLPDFAGTAEGTNLTWPLLLANLKYTQGAF